jgi:hypothetical protein
MKAAFHWNDSTAGLSALLVTWRVQVTGEVQQQGESLLRGWSIETVCSLSRFAVQSTALVAVYTAAPGLYGLTAHLWAAELVNEGCIPLE